MRVETEETGSEPSNLEAMIRVVVTGAAGRMGSTAMNCLTPEAGFEIIAGITRQDGLAGLRAALDQRPDVLLELSTAASATDYALEAAHRGIAVVIGTTGIADLEPLRVACSQAPILLVPNFSIGAVLMMQFSQLAAKWLPECEIIEMHHEKKLDAPSGTAIRTAELITESRTRSPQIPTTQNLKISGARGGTLNEIPIHSIRLPGLLAHQKVLFGGIGEVLTVQHDSMNRSSFEAGMQLCCRRIRELSGFNIGMEHLLA